MAAATSAVFGSYFGVFGTVGGAAAGSVATAMTSDIYQRVLERTRDRIRPRGGAPAGGYLPSPGQAAPRARRRGLPRLLFVSVVIFALGMGVVSGIEWVRGAPLSGGERGTSLSHVLPDGLGGTVDGLLGGSDHDSDSDDSHSDSSDRDSSDRDSSDGGSGHSTGLVGGLLSGL
jgi:hypothetical protein